MRILLADLQVQPQLQPLPIDATLGDTAADAVLLIGDRAIHSPPGRFAEVWDLGDRWQQSTGLPFVFAMWVARPGIETDEIAKALAAARDAGVAHLEEVAAAEAAKQGLTVPQCVSYLHDNLHFYLGDHERQGLDLFYRKTIELGLAVTDCRTGSFRTYPDRMERHFDKCKK